MEDRFGMAIPMDEVAQKVEEGGKEMVVMSRYELLMHKDGDKDSKLLILIVISLRPSTLIYHQPPHRTYKQSPSQISGKEKHHPVRSLTNSENLPEVPQASNLNNHDMCT